MTEGAINKVLYNVDQRADTTAAEKKTARDNIGAIGADEVPGIADDRYKLLQIPTSVSYAANAVVSRLEQDAQGVVSLHCSYLTTATESGDGLMSAADKLKLDYIQAGAEANVQADWAVDDPASDAYIRNKPILLQVQSNWAINDPADPSYILNKPDLSVYATQTDLAGKQDTLTAGNNITITNNVISATAAPQEQADWTQADSSAVDYIKHKPDLSQYATQQDLSGKQDTLTAGQNITITNNVISATAAPQEQADWAQTNSSAVDFIKNKPQNLVQDANYVHTDNNFTTDERNKLSSIEFGAQANVQSDWNQSNSSSDSYIQNKPQNLVQDANYVHTDNNFTTAEKNKLSGIEAGAQANVQSDWNQSNSSADDYIKNKPSIPVIPSLKELVAGTGISMVEGTNEVTISTSAVIDATYVHTDNNFTTALKNKLSGIEAGAEVNVQADWNQSDSSADDFVKNKPTVPEITWTQDNQGSSVITEADKLNINQDTHRVQMGAGSTTVELGFTVPPMVTAPQEDMFLKMAQGNTVPTWDVAPEGHTVGFMTISFQSRYDYGEYGYMGFGPKPDLYSIILNLTAETGQAFFCGTATYWGLCAYNPEDKTQYAVLNNPLHEVYHINNSYIIVADNENVYPGVPKTVSVTIPGNGSWHFYGGLRSLAGCALCIITYEGTGEHITKTYGDSPCNSDYASINGTVNLSYENAFKRYVGSIDDYPIFAERSTNDANGYNIEATYLKKADEQVYTAGAGLNETTLLPSGEHEFSWAYTVGRNLHVNQDNAIQTKLPGGTLDPSSTSWQAVGEFAGAYRMLARANSDGTYDLGVSYYGQGASSTFTIIGQQIVAEPSSTTLSITKCNYINESVDNLGTRIGPHFDPATMQSLTIEGHAYIGPLSDFRATLWTDGTTVHAAFSAIEVGTVGATN